MFKIHLLVKPVIFESLTVDPSKFVYSVRYYRKKYFVGLSCYCNSVFRPENFCEDRHNLNHQFHNCYFYPNISNDSFKRWYLFSNYNHYFIFHYLVMYLHLDCNFFSGFFKDYSHFMFNKNWCFKSIQSVRWVPMNPLRFLHLSYWLLGL